LFQGDDYVYEGLGVIDIGAVAIDTVDDEFGYGTHPG
jgi:hypothetical protein